LRCRQGQFSLATLTAATTAEKHTDNQEPTPDPSAGEPPFSLLAEGFAKG